METHKVIKLTDEELSIYRQAQIYKSFYGTSLHEEYKDYIDFDNLRNFFWYNLRFSEINDYENLNEQI